MIDLYAAAQRLACFCDVTDMTTLVLTICPPATGRSLDTFMPQRFEVSTDKPRDRLQRTGTIVHDAGSLPTPNTLPAQHAGRKAKTAETDTDQ